MAAYGQPTSIDMPAAKIVILYWSQNHDPKVIIVRCMDRVFGKKDVEAKYMPLDMSRKAMQ